MHGPYTYLYYFFSKYHRLKYIYCHSVHMIYFKCVFRLRYLHVQKVPIYRFSKVPVQRGFICFLNPQNECVLKSTA